MKRSIRGIALAAVAVAALVASQSQAEAVNTYTVQANSPKPATCGNSGTIPAGTWLVNKTCGYYIGEAMANATFDDQSTASDGFHFGRVHGDVNLCGWIPPKALSASPTGTADPTCSAATEDAMSHRLSFGYNFNAAAHAAQDGTEVTTTAGCQEDYNYFTTSTLSTGTLHDPAGPAAADVYYRYTANGDGGSVAEVRDPNLGWVFIPISCITDFRGMTFHNDND